MRWLVYGSVLMLGAITAWRLMPPGWRRDLRLSARDGGVAQCRMAFEFAMVLCLMLLASPMSSKAHYVVLVLPCLLVARYVVEQRGACRWAVLGVLACLGPLSAGELTGDALGDLLLAWGGPTWFVLVLLAVLWWQIPAWPRPTAEMVDPPAQVDGMSEKAAVPRTRCAAPLDQPAVPPAEAA
jgi:hypothetical protein